MEQEGPRKIHCPKCGRFMRVIVSHDNGYWVAVGFCDKDRISYILDEVYRGK